MLRSFRATKIALAALVALTCSLPCAQAQSINVSPTAGTYSVGQTFSVRALVSSPSDAINAISATLAFPSDRLQVLSVSKTGSVMSFWVTEPTFSNAAGSVDLAGVVPNPGFTGSSGTVMTVNFRALKAGQATVSFSSGSLLANDGNGTDILKSLGSAVYNVVPAAVVPEETTPAKPIVEPLSLNIQDMRAGDLTISSVPVKPLTTGGTLPIDHYEFVLDGVSSRWKPDAAGVYVTTALAPGHHSLSSRAFDSAGVTASASLDIEVAALTAEKACPVTPFSFLGESLLSMLVLAVLIAALIVALIVLVLHALKKTRSFRSAVHKEAEEAQKILHESFDGMRENMESYVDMLESASAERRLTDEEKKLVKLLRQNLNDAEKIIGREIGDIDKKTHAL